ncbi:MAG: response regulator, partial [Nitrospirota bacterium]
MTEKLIPRIMVVEDESVTAISIKTSLEEMGYAVSGIYESGEAAVKNARDEKPDLVLMDITLKGAIDGIKAARKIPLGHRIPVVYLTAHADEQTLRQAKMTEPFGYIVKPFDDRELKVAVEIALYKHKMES